MESPKYLSKESTNCMKGIFAIFVLWHHLYQYSGLLHDTYLGVIFQAMGYLSVGMFFFFTGYGLMFSTKYKKNYMEDFLSKRFLPLYVFYVVLIALYALYDKLIGNSLTATTSLVKSLLFGGTIVPFGWYLQVTFLLYLLFYFIYKFIKSTKAQVFILTLCLVLYCVISHFCGLATTWYESVFCVVLGMIFSLEKEQIDAALNKKALLIMLSSVVLFSICFVGYRVFPLGIIFKIASSLFFAIVTISLAFLLQNTSVVCNKFTTILGAFSLEIYVSQGFMIALRKGANFHIDNPYIFVLCAIIGTFAISYVMKKIYDQVVGLTLKLVNKTS